MTKELPNSTYKLDNFCCVCEGNVIRNHVYMIVTFQHIVSNISFSPLMLFYLIFLLQQLFLVSIRIYLFHFFKSFCIILLDIAVANHIEPYITSLEMQFESLQFLIGRFNQFIFFPIITLFGFLSSIFLYFLFIMCVFFFTSRLSLFYFLQVNKMLLTILSRNPIIGCLSYRIKTSESTCI